MALLVAGIEGGLRLLGYRPAGLRAYSIEFSAPDPRLGFRAYRNAGWYFDVTPGGGPVERKIGTTNADGYRPTIENANCESCPYIVVVGDSVSFDAEVSDRETWPEMLAREFARSGTRYKVLNISFRGWSTLQEAQALKDANLAGKKIAYVLYLAVPNDVVENIHPIYQLPAPIGVESGGTFSLRPPVLDNAVLAMSRKWKLENFARRYATTTLLYKWAGKPLIGSRDAPPPIATADSDYRVPWNGTLKRVEEYLGLLNGKGPESQLAQDAFAYGVKDMADTSRRLGAKFVLVPCPFGPYTRGGNAREFARLLQIKDEELNAFLDEWDRYNHALARIAKANGADYLDIDLNALSGLGYRDYTATPRDWHFSVKADERLAREVHAALREGRVDRAGGGEAPRKGE